MYFSRVSDPKVLRIALLETSRETLILLRQQKEYYAVRERKKQLVEDLRKDVREISEMLKRIDEFFPDKQTIKQEILDEQKHLVEQQTVLERAAAEEKERLEREERLQQIEARKRDIMEQRKIAEAQQAKKAQEERTRRLVESAKNKRALKPMPVLRHKDVEVKQIVLQTPKLPPKQILKPVDNELEKSSVTDMDRLEYTLSKIEQKLNQLKQ